MKYGYIPKTFSQDADKIDLVKVFMESLGIKDLIEKKLYTTLKDQILYLRYVGPIVIPVRYKLKDNHGKWGEWISVKS